MISKVGLVALVATAALAPSCKTKQISFALDVPSSLGQQIAWFEIGAYANVACPTDAQLAGGVPKGGTAAYVAFPASASVPPSVGSLPRGRYAFAAVARQSDCSVIATGCDSVDLSQTSDVSIQPPAHASRGPSATTLSASREATSATPASERAVLCSSPGRARSGTRCR
jgi:hypothetical protein